MSPPPQARECRPFFIESASLPSPRMHMRLIVRTWHRSHQAAKFSPPHVCVTPQARCPLVAIFCRLHPMFRNTSAPPRGATIKANITTFRASTSRWTHHKHRTPSSKATVTSMWPSNVLRVVVVLLWALPTLCAAECAVLNPTESSAKDGRCPYGRGGLGKYFLHLAGRIGERLFLGQTNPGQFPACARFAHHKTSLRFASIVLSE